MGNNGSNSFGRRNFLKGLSVGAASIPLFGCSRKSDGEKLGAMTMRTNPKTGEKVSILGFGCMRWPSVDGRSAREAGGEIDQQAVNELVDCAIANGVNYFDTSPVYCQGRSEHVTGIALSRHPREKYFIATKLSNFAKSTWTKEASIAMYRNSMKELKTDYIDYMLLHGVGMGDDGMEGSQKTLSRKRRFGVPLGGAQGGANPQLGVLVPRRHKGFRLSALEARRL